LNHKTVGERGWARTDTDQFKPVNANLFGYNADNVNAIKYTPQRDRRALSEYFTV